MKVGDLVKSKFTDPVNQWTHTVGTVVDVATLGGTDGAWVDWFNKGIYWSPLGQLEIISEAG